MENSQTNQDHFANEIQADMKEGQDFPELKKHSSVFMKNQIVLFGGEYSNYKYNNIFHILNLETGGWSQKELIGESNEIPKPRIWHTANTIGNNIYILSGLTKNYRGDKNVYEIDFETLKCQIIGEIVNPVQGHTADVYDQSIYVFGGQSMETNEYPLLLQKFSLLTNECEEIKPTGYLQEGRCAHKSIIVKNNMYIFGGWSGKTYLQDMISINLSNNVSTEIEQNGQIPSPRCQFSFFEIENKLYLFGGRTKSDYYQDFYSFDLKTSTWKAQEAKNQKCLLKRAYHSTVAVKESSRKLKVYLVGGEQGFSSFQKNMNVLTLSINRIYWILHYLHSTGIQNLPGYCLIQEIIELFE